MKMQEDGEPVCSSMPAPSPISVAATLHCKPGWAHVDNEKVVRNWHAAIADECRRILGRELTPAESAFITCRSGFIALEMVGDHVRGLARNPDGLQRYLRSEAESNE